MWGKGSSNHKVAQVAEVNQPLPILIPDATSMLSHGPVSVHVVTADLGVQVSHDSSGGHGEVLRLPLPELLVEGALSVSSLSFVGA